MEYTISDLKKKRVVSVADGKDLGKVTDVNFLYPEGTIIGFILSDRKKFFGGEKYLLKLSCVEKIGKDAILVRAFEKTGEESLTFVQDEAEDE